MGQHRTRTLFTAEASQHQEKRRSAFIARSKDARSDALHRARQVAIQESESDSEMVRTAACCLQNRMFRGCERIDDDATGMLHKPFALNTRGRIGAN